jgi:hypothetical protein
VAARRVIDLRRPRRENVYSHRRSARDCDLRKYQTGPPKRLSTTALIYIGLAVLRAGRRGYEPSAF